MPDDSLLDRERLPERAGLVASVLLFLGGLVALGIGRRRAKEPGLVAAEERPAADDVLAGEHIHVPAPSLWPAVLAFGVTLIAFGVVTSLAFSALGGLLLARGLIGWIAELRDDG